MSVVSRKLAFPTGDITSLFFKLDLPSYFFDSLHKFSTIICDLPKIQPVIHLKYNLIQTNHRLQLEYVVSERLPLLFCPASKCRIDLVLTSMQHMSIVSTTWHDTSSWIYYYIHLTFNDTQMSNMVSLESIILENISLVTQR